MVRLMVERGGVSVHARSPTEPNTSLVLAAGRGHSDVVRFLLAHGASLNDVDDGGKCFLEYANASLADLMLAAVTADPNMLDRVDDLLEFAWRLLLSSQPEAAVLLEMVLAQMLSCRPAPSTKRARRRTSTQSRFCCGAVSR